jgi:hypothetical protein
MSLSVYQLNVAYTFLTREVSGLHPLPRRPVVPGVLDCGVVLAHFQTPFPKPTPRHIQPLIQLQLCYTMPGKAANAAHKRRRLAAADFKKRKKKVGRKLAPTNATNVGFSARKVRVPGTVQCVWRSV